VIVRIVAKPRTFTGSGFMMDMASREKYGITAGWLVSNGVKVIYTELWEIDITDDNLTLLLLRPEICLVEILDITVLGGVPA